MEYVVNLEFSEEGAEKFAQATEDLLGDTISVWMDDVMISAPRVSTVVDSGTCYISGSHVDEQGNTQNGFTAAEASALASKIQCRRPSVCFEERRILVPSAPRWVNLRWKLCCWLVLLRLF